MSARGTAEKSVTGAPICADIALRFAAHLKRRDLPAQSILPRTCRHVTEVAERLAFKEAGARRFIALSYDSQRDYMRREEIALWGYANAS